MSLTPIIDVLGEDPPTVHRLNACAYQQSAITSFAGLQYAAFYTPGTTSTSRFVTLARRNIKQNPAVWHSFTFTDYEQTVDDGHNTTSIGICRGDGTIHVTFDHHCDALKYRVSRKGLASDTNEAAWNVDAFGLILDRLPNSCSAEPLVNVTYPRFLPVGDKMLFECRIGKAGAGSDILYIYNADSSQFTFLGTYLRGNECNPYPNGLSFHPSTNTVHVTWTNRHFIEYDGADDPNSTVHKGQAGPNGPENNEGLYHAYSADGCKTWLSSSYSEETVTITVLSPESKDTGLDSRDLRLLVREIPRNSGIMNQEGQTVDSHGGIHVLNRQRITNSNPNGTLEEKEEEEEEEERWVHYYHRPSDSEWSSSILPSINPTETGPRGKLIHHAASDRLFFILPSNTQSELLILRSGPRDNQGFYGDYEIIWRGNGYTGEPLVDEEGFVEFGVLSIFTTRGKVGGKREVVVLHFRVDDLVLDLSVE